MGWKLIPLFCWTDWNVLHSIHQLCSKCRSLPTSIIEDIGKTQISAPGSALPACPHTIVLKSLKTYVENNWLKRILGQFQRQKSLSHTFFKNGGAAPRDHYEMHVICFFKMMVWSWVTEEPIHTCSLRGRKSGPLHISYKNFKWATLQVWAAWSGAGGDGIHLQRSGSGETKQDIPENPAGALWHYCIRKMPKMSYGTN